MIKKQFLKLIFVTLVTLGDIFWVASERAIAQVSVTEEQIDIRRGLSWGGNKLPYNDVADIKDSLTDKILGKLVIDHHGVSGTPVGDDWAGHLAHAMVNNPFSRVYPGGQVFISLWGSRSEGCFVDYVLQYAASPEDNNVDLNQIKPTLLEIQIGSQTIELPPFSQVTDTKESRDYSYTVRSGRLQINGKWYMTRNVFVVDAAIANVLRNAPSAEVRTRLTLANGKRIIVPIGSGTVSKWKEAYGYNPTCQSPEQAKKDAEQAQKQTQIAVKLSLGLSGLFKSYRNSEEYNQTLEWLQEKLSPSTLATFSGKWRNRPASQGQSIRLVDIGKFYRNSSSQNSALKWLQDNIPQDILSEFASKWPDNK